MSGTVYSYPNNWRVKRIQAIAALAGFEIKEEAITIPDLKTNPEHAKKWPVGCVPVFESGDFHLSETAAIAEYVLSQGTSAPKYSAKESALISQWVNVVDQEIAARVQTANGMNNYIPYSKPTQAWIVAKAVERLVAINSYLNTATFLVGDRITPADLTFAAALQAGFASFFDASVRKQIPNVLRYFETVTGNSKYSAIFGTTTYSETAPQPAKKEKEAKPAAPAAAAAPKAEKAPKAKKAVEKDDDEEEELTPAEPKAKNPLDDLPKSDFKLDDWKRTYSNEDTRKTALPWLYENLDKEGFSLWKVDFKYNTELTQVFMSSNLIGGFFNRLEGSRKYAMGSMGVFGKSNDSVITGAFIIRGKEPIPVFSAAPDYESYEYTALDISSAADKEFFEGALAWDLVVDGKEWADGKVYK